jgi:ribosomal protein L32
MTPKYLPKKITYKRNQRLSHKFLYAIHVMVLSTIFKKLYKLSLKQSVHICMDSLYAMPLGAVIRFGT